MLLRPATPDDVPSILPMVAALAALHESWDPQRFDYRPETAAMYDGWLRGHATNPKSVFLVAERQGRVVAFLIGTVERTIPIYRLEQVGFIHDLWVDPGYRHEGIGRLIAMRAIELFREKGVVQMRLETASANEPARKLFESCGFRPCSTEMLIDLGGEQAKGKP